MKSKIQTILKKLMRPQFAILGLLLAAGMIGGTVAAKYIRQRSDQGIVRAEWFYFNSDLLKEGTEKSTNNTYYFDPGTKEITFTLMSREDELRYSEMDIQYTVTVQEKEGTTWKDLYNNTGIIKNEDGTSTDVPITIDADANLNEHNGLDGTYRITATGYCQSADGKTKGYEKTLTAYILTKKLCYYVDDNTDEGNDPYVVLLTVYAQGYTGTVTIVYPEGLIPDNTDERMAEVKTGAPITDDVTFNSNGYSSHTYRFFMSNSYAGRSESDSDAVIDGNRFTVTGTDIETSYEKPAE